MGFLVYNVKAQAQSRRAQSPKKFRLVRARASNSSNFVRLFFSILICSLLLIACLLLLLLRLCVYVCGRRCVWFLSPGWVPTKHLTWTRNHLCLKVFSSSFPSGPKPSRFLSVLVSLFLLLCLSLSLPFSFLSQLGREKTQLLFFSIVRFIFSPLLWRTDIHH